MEVSTKISYLQHMLSGSAKWHTCLNLAIFLLFTTPLWSQDNPVEANGAPPAAATSSEEQSLAWIHSRERTTLSIPPPIQVDTVVSALGAKEKRTVLWTSKENSSVVALALKLGLKGKHVVSLDQVSTSRPEHMWGNCEHISVLLDPEKKLTVTVRKRTTPVEESSNGLILYVYGITFGIKYKE